MMHWQDPQGDRMAELDRIIASEHRNAATEPGIAAKRLPWGKGRTPNAMCRECSTRFCAHVMPVFRLPWFRARLLLGLTHGWSNEELAAHLGVTDQTVKIYASGTCKIMGLTSRLELALWAIDHREEIAGIIAKGAKGKRLAT